MSEVEKFVGHPAAMVVLAGEILGIAGPFCQIFMKSVKIVPAAMGQEGQYVIVFLPREE